MKYPKISILFLLILALTLFAVPSAKAETTQPVGSCPNGFQLMQVMQHDDMEHTHIGVTVDLNQDGWLCMKEATPTLHVHVDDSLPLP